MFTQLMLKRSYYETLNAASQSCLNVLGRPGPARLMGPHEGVSGVSAQFFVPANPAMQLGGEWGLGSIPFPSRLGGLRERRKLH